MGVGEFPELPPNRVNGKLKTQPKPLWDTKNTPLMIEIRAPEQFLKVWRLWLTCYKLWKWIKSVSFKVCNIFQDLQYHHSVREYCVFCVLVLRFSHWLLIESRRMQWKMFSKHFYTWLQFKWKPGRRTESRDDQEAAVVVTRGEARSKARSMLD